MSQSALDQLVQLSGLSPIFASTVIRRAVQRAGVDPSAFAARDLERVLPEIERALRVYIGEEAEARVAAIRAKMTR